MLRARRAITQARGRARREKLLDAARSLLQSHEIDEITLADVAAGAGIPKSSSYHFYNAIHDLYAELAAAQDAELYQVLGEPIDPKPDWGEVLREMVLRAGAYFKANPSAQKLMFGPKTPPDIKRASRTADVAHGALFEAQIGRQFALPEIPDRPKIFFRAVEAIDLMFGLSLIEQNHLTDEMVDEAFKLAQAYLALYIPRLLPRLEVMG